MSIKIFNEETGQWEIKASNHASEVEVEDVTGELEAEDVEGALTSLVDKIDDVEFDIYDTKKQIKRTDEKVNSVLEEFKYHLDNHPSGGGQDGIMPTITSTFENNTVVDKGQTVYIPIFFSSGNLGNGTAYILINNVEVGSQSIKQGSNNIEVGVMPTQLNTVAIYVKDRGGLLSNQLSWTVICGGIEVSTTFDFEADYPMGETIRFPFNISTQSDDDIVMYLTIDQDIKMINCVNGYNEYILPELGVGIHRISFYVESGRYLTEVYNYNLVIVDSNNLYISTTFEDNQEIMYGKPISINYRVSKASTENFTVNLYMNDNLEKTQTTPAGSYYWTITRLPIGEYKIKIEATGVQGDYAFIELSFKIVEGVYSPVEPVNGGLIAYFNAKGHSNQDDDREFWRDESGNGVIATLHNFNYGNNGWMGDYLQCSGDAYVEIELQPYLDNVKQGSTIDIHFNQTSVGIENARVLDYTEIENPQKGIYIDTLETKLVSEVSSGLVKLDENVDTRLTYVIDRENRIAVIYLNGVINRVFQLSDSGSGVNASYENFAHAEKIYLNSRKGQDLFSDCKIYSLRVYNRALNHEEVLQNHIADIDDMNVQEQMYNKNYANYDIPEIRMYGNTENMTGEIFQTMRIKYTSPNEDLYGQSFDTMYNQVRWQGTSSQTYAMKNYQVYLKDNDMADMYYTPFQNGIPEHIFCFKCNYMESSHMNNTGIATFANDCVFTTPNPAQAKNPQVRNSIDGFPCLLYINDELEGVYTFNLDRYSTNSLGYDTTQFPKCLSYEISANSDTTAGAFVPWTTATGKTEIEYLSADFRCRYPDNRVNGDDDFAELKRLVDWVGNATDDMFREQIDQYFNLEYLIRYYLTVQLFGLIDNLGKNTMLTTFDGNVWYMQLYDCDSCTGLDNSGAMKFDSDIEVVEGIFNTSSSRLWEKLRRNFPTQILAQWEYLRLNEFTEENIMKYLVDNISDKIPEVNYNKDAWKKYIQLGTSYLFACHGNRRQQIQRWIRERLIYVDTLLEYTVSTNDYLTVRVNKLGEVHFDIQTFQPMYFSIKFRNETGGTIRHRVGRGETVRFSYNIPVATDQEILVYGGRFVKDLGDLSEMNPKHLLLEKASRLTKLKCNNADALITASISDCIMLQEVDLRGCSNLGAGSDASLQTLDLAKCRNLRFVDIFGTQLTALHTSKVGGIIQEIIYPYSVQVVDIANQSRLQSVGIPCYYTGDYQDENNIFAENLSEVTLSNCPNIVSFVKNYCVDENGNEIPVPTFVGVSKGQMFNLSNTMTYLTQIDLSYCSNIISLTLDNFDKLTEINFDDISMWNATSSNLENLTLTNCPNVETLTFNQNTIDGNNSLGVAFKEGTVLDLSGLYNLKHIRSNVGIKGLKKLILPLTIQSLVFDYPEDTTYSLGDSDIESIFSKDAVHDNDGFSGIDLLNIQTITDFSMGSLTKMNNAINLDIKITNTFPYFNYFKTSDYFKPEGTVDITEYKDNLDYLFKGVDLNKLTIICDEPLPHTSASYMFAFATCQDTEVINDLFDLIPNVTDFSYMFYNAYLKEAPYIPLRAENVSYMFYNNTVMESTPSNWLQSYNSVPNSAYCYTGCVNIKWIDGIEGSIDVIPSKWGGYERINTTMMGENLVIEKTLEREIERFVAGGQSFHNVAPLVGQTPTITANESSQNIGQGLSSDILLNDGKAPYGELEGLTLVNIASERRSRELTTKKEKDGVLNILPTIFKIDESKEMIVARLEGSTLHNVANQDSKTTLQTNGNYGTFEIDENIDETTHIKDGKMYSTTLYGQTISNDMAKTTIKHELDENNTNKLITQHDDKEIVYEYGNFENANLKGKTLVNVVEDSKDDDYVSFNEDISGQHITIEDSKYGSIKNVTVQGETLVNIVQEPSETEYVITGDAFEGQSGALENIVEGNIKSAILKGRMLENLATQGSGTFSGRFINVPLSKSLVKGKKYIVKLKVETSTLPNGFRLRFSKSGGTTSPFNVNTAYQATSDGLNTLQIYTANANDVANGYTATIKDIMVIEYQKGMEDWDIPYFEGEQSVNLYPNQTIKKITWSSGCYYTEQGTLTSVNATANHKYFEEYFEVMPNHTLRVKGNNTTKYLNFYDESKTFISRATLTSTDDLVATVPSNARYYRYSMLVNSGMTDETVIYDEDMKINIADTSIEADYLQKMSVLQTGSNIISTYKPTSIISDNVKVNASDFHNYSSTRGRFYKIPPHTQGFKIHVKRNTDTVETSGSFRVFLTIVDNTNTSTITSDLQLAGTSKVHNPTKDVVDYNTSWNRDFSEYADKYLVVSYRDLAVNTKNDFTVRVLALTDIENLEGYDIEFGKLNFLSTNEEIKLRSNGNVYDELDLLSGKLIQRIDENKEVLEQEIIKTVSTTILDQDDNTIENLHTFDTTIYIDTYAQGGGLTPFVNIPENISYNTGNMLKPNTTYTLQMNRKESDYPLITIVDGEEVEVRDNKTVFTTSSTINDTNIKFYGKNNIISKVQLIEGDYINTEIPFFEGIQSVKMTALTTSNEDGTKTNILTVNEEATLRSNGDVYDELNLLTGRLTQRIDENNEVLAQAVVKTVDLNIIDQDGKEIDNIHTFDNLTHINTDSNGLIPIVNINKEVSYESILKPSTTYTFSFNQVNIGDEDLIINAGGTEVVYDGSENMTITTPSELLNNTISFYGKNHIVNNLVMVEGEKKINIYRYFTGMANYKKESDKKSILTISNYPLEENGLHDDFKMNILESDEEINLRSNGEIYDELNLLTGELIQRIDENGEILSQEVIKTINLRNKPSIDWQGDVYLRLENNTLYPQLDCEIESINYYEIPKLKANTLYTLRYVGEPTQCIFGGLTYETENNMILTSGSSDNLLYFDKEVRKVVLIEGDVRDRNFDYFEGIESLGAVEIITHKSDMSIFSKVQLPPHIQLRRLPDGTCDELDIKTGILTRRIDENYNLLEEEITEKLILNYNNSCNYGVILPRGTSDNYNVITNEYKQNLDFIPIDGSITFDTATIKDTTVKFSVTLSKFEVDTTNVRGNDGIYCDNNLFKYETSDNDYEHAYIEDGTTLHIYVNKNRLSSYDQVGFQLYLSSNPFNVYYAMRTPIISYVNYEDLNPEKASWEMLDCIEDGSITIESEELDKTLLLDCMDYVAPTKNRFEIDLLKANTQYTVYAEGVSSEIQLNFGGNIVNFTSGNIYTSGATQLVEFYTDNEIKNLIIIEGDTRTETINFFEGLKSSENVTVISTNAPLVFGKGGKIQ